MDYISDIITKIKNANWAYKPNVSLAYTSLGLAIVEALAKNGYVGVPQRKGKKLKFIEVPLVYESEQPKIVGVKRLSTPAKRIYSGALRVKPVRNGFGKVLISTSKGVMTGEEAKKEKLGGELLFEVW